MVEGRAYGGLAADERQAGRRARLLEAGLDLLAREGWTATTVTAVCARAGLTARYFYESFRDRDELVVAIFDGIVAEVTARAGAATDARETVRATIAAWVDIALDDPRKARVAFIEALGSETLMRRRLGSMRAFAELVSRQAGAPDVAGQVVAGGLVETMIAWLEDGCRRDAAALVADFTAVCAAALTPSTPRAARGRRRPRTSTS